MEIRLSEVVLEDTRAKDIKEFERFYDNSYKAALRSKRSIGDKLAWKARFIVEDEDEGIESEYIVDTKGNYITYLHLDGHLDGEIIELDDEIELHLATRNNSILEALVFTEVSRLKLLSEEKLKAVEYSLFPKFAKGYIATDLKQDKNVKSFMDIFYPFLEKHEIIKTISVSKFSYKVLNTDEASMENFRKNMEEYIFEDLYFIYYDRGYGDFLAKKDFNEILMAGIKFEPDTTMLELYED